MNFLEKVKKTSEHWNCFSKADVLGSFDFMTLTISLESLSIKDVNYLEKLLIEGSYKDEILDRNISYADFSHKCATQI